jgi:cytochrome c biogenesis factor
MEVEPEDEIQDAVPQVAPERLPTPFKYHEARSRPRGMVIGLVIFVDLMLLLVGGLLTLMINFQSFADSGPKDTTLADKQVSETLWLGGVVAVILVAAAVTAFWARADATGLLQCVLVVFVLLLTASADADLRHPAPSGPTPNYQPAPVNSNACFSGSNDCPGG